MQNEELCIKVLSEILGIEIRKVEYPQYEKKIDIRYDSGLCETEFLKKVDIYNKK